ncbi:MAG: hypothetical protein LUG98_13945 [Tannerellaceae bacterium]|nr:hypothetical protein [Tannerellaceae bacterium]
MKKDLSIYYFFTILFLTGWYVVSSCTETEKENSTGESKTAYTVPVHQAETASPKDPFLVEEDYVPGTIEFSFGFLWDNPEEDADSIRSAMLKMRERSWFDHNLLGYFGHYYEYMNEAELAFDKIGVFLSQYYTSEDLPSIFESYAKYIPLFIPKNVYKKKGFERVHIQLMAAYLDLHSRNCFEEIYEICENREDPAEGILNITNPRQFDCFYDTGELREGDVLLAYSFWGRRHKQGIHRELYYMLKRIYGMYN